MTIPELYWENAEEIIKWHQKEIPESYKNYTQTLEKIKKKNFPKAITLLKNLKNNRQVNDFLSFLTEINIAKLLIEKSVGNLEYEPHSGIDFSFEDIAISIKNLHSKKYQKEEDMEINNLKKNGSGKVIFTRENSTTEITVQKTNLGSHTWERIETGNNGFVDSDRNEMWKPLECLREFEETEIKDKKRVLFFFIYSSELQHYHINDMLKWYFDIPNDWPIFKNKPSLYFELFKKSEKKKNIDGIIFMFSPKNTLIWPENCLTELINNKPRLVIFSPNKNLRERLRRVFS